MEDSKVYEGVISVITEIVDNVKISESDYDTVLKDLGIDSLDTYSILLELEEKFEVQDLLEEDPERLNTINDIVRFIIEKSE